MPSTRKPPYIPRIERTGSDVRQVMLATNVVIEVDENDTAWVVFTEDVGNTAIHGLLFAISAGDDASHDSVYVEFNDQGNGLTAREVESVELTPRELKLRPVPGRGLGSGRLSYQEVADPLEDVPEVEYPTLDEVLVRHSFDAKQLAEIDAVLHRLVARGVTYRSSVRREPIGDQP